MIPSLVMIWTSSWSGLVEGRGGVREESMSEVEVVAVAGGDVDVRAARNSDSCVFCISEDTG